MTYDCQTCGLCCVSLTGFEAYADCTPRDLERLPKTFRRLHVVNNTIRTRDALQRSGPLKGATATACAALRGALLKSTKCSIYENRPSVCRTAIRPGDRSCRQTRKLFQEFLESS